MGKLSEALKSTKSPMLHTQVFYLSFLLGYSIELVILKKSNSEKSIYVNLSIQIN